MAPTRDVTRVCVACDTSFPIANYRVTSWQPTGPYRSKTCRHCDPLPDAVHRDASGIGYVYVLLLPTGEIKIGWSADVETRVKDIGRQDYSGTRPIILAVMPGTGALESELHTLWSRFRLSGNGERFTADRTLLSWIVGLADSEHSRPHEITKKLAMKL